MEKIGCVLEELWSQHSLILNRLLVTLKNDMQRHVLGEPANGLMNHKNKARTTSATTAVRLEATVDSVERVIGEDFSASGTC